MRVQVYEEQMLYLCFDWLGTMIFYEVDDYNKTRGKAENGHMGWPCHLWAVMADTKETIVFKNQQ